MGDEGKSYDLDTFTGLDEYLGDHARIFHPQYHEPFVGRSVTCPTCCAPRNAEFRIRIRGDGGGHARPGLLMTVMCRECHTSGFVLLFTGPNGGEAAYHWPVLGGLRTPHTPEAVGYYLDQAARSESGGARSAATAMYRSALEHILHEQGYPKGMLNEKLTALQAAIDKGTAKKWAMDIEPAFLRVIKDLGNGAMHTNGGDHTKQTALDSELLRKVHETVRELLDMIYEEPLRRAARLAALTSAAAKVK